MVRGTALGLLALSGLLGMAGCKKEETPTIKVGSKDFTEQLILGEIVAQHLEHRLSGVRIQRVFRLGGTLAANQALLAGEVDLYPEYSGAALTAILKLPPTSDRSAVREQVRQNYSYQFKVSWLPPLGFDNGFAVAVRSEDAKRYDLKTISDAARRSEGWTIGTGNEFLTRPDGYSLLMRVYQMPVKPPIQTLDQDLLYSALTEKQVDMVFGYATDAMITSKNLVVLTDDKHAFPPGEAAIAARMDTLERFPRLGPALHELSRRFTDPLMRNLNYEVEVKHRTPAEVAAETLRQFGLSK